MKIKEVKYERTTRKDFSKVGDYIEMPNLIKVQKDSYDWFVEEGLGEVLKDISPIVDYTGNLVLEFFDYYMEEKTKYTLEEAKERDATYSTRLHVKVRLINRESGEIKEVPVIVKSDVQGTAEAVASSLSKIDVDGVKVNVIRSAAGSISESDVILASVSHAVIYGFNVRPDANVRKKAQEENVEIRLHNIIYKAVEEMEAAMKGMLAPVFEEVVLGQAEVRKTYKVSKVGTIAGCMVTEGKIIRDGKCRLIRDGIVVYTGKLASLKRFENDAKEVLAGYECGLTIENFNDLKEKDIVEVYQDQEVKAD